MTQSLPPSTHGARRRAGFTLVELLVVITIIGMLMALVIPAIGAARDAARTATCLNNLKQIGTAIINYETSKSRFPGYVQPIERNDNTFVQIDLSGGITTAGLETVDVSMTDAEQRRSSLMSWAAVIQPQLQRQDLYDNMVDGAIRLSAGDARATVTQQDVLVCPADTDLTSRPDVPGMTYSVNTGSWDYAAPNDHTAVVDTATTSNSPSGFLPVNPNGTPPTGDTRDNGLCHNRALGNLKLNQSQIHDGTSYTLMISENVHKETEDPSFGAYSWAGVGGRADSADSLHLAEQVFGLVWLVNTSPTSTNAQAPFSGEDPRLSESPPNSSAITAYPDNLPYYARPASGHPSGIFNVIMADGSARALSPDLNYVVYQQLMTPKGRDCVDPRDHEANLAVGQPIQAFRAAAPLSADSFQ